MSKLGTCRHCHQIQEAYIVPAYRQPHEPEQTREDMPEQYTCQWLDGFKKLPPPIRRADGGFLLRDGDCEACLYHEEAGGNIFKSPVR